MIRYKILLVGWHMSDTVQGFRPRNKIAKRSAIGATLGIRLLCRAGWQRKRTILAHLACDLEGLTVGDCLCPLDNVLLLCPTHVFVNMKPVNL